MKNLIIKVKNGWRAVSAILFPLLLICFGNWTSEALAGEQLFLNWSRYLEDYQGGVRLLVTLVCIWSLTWIYIHRGRYLPVRSLSRSRSKPRACLILMISPSNKRIPLPVQFPLTIDSTTLKGDSLDEDISALHSVKWNWQPLLRSIKVHCEKLSRIYLIGSIGQNGSYHSLGSCKLILNKYVPAATIETFSKPVDPEDLDELMEITSTLVHAAKGRGIKEQDIVIDVTGGQKTTSIAAALFTLSSRVTFQYVQTNDPYDVITYDIASEAPPGSS